MIDQDIIQLFHSLPERIIATVHKDPDYDAIGSLLALKQLLFQLGHEVTLYSPDISQKHFRHLPGIKKIVTTPRSEYDLAIFLDCSDKSRIASLNNFPAVKRIVNIDHHQDNTLFGDVNIVQNISSVGEILFHMFNQLGVEISTDVATCLYFAICFDTGNFKFSNTTSDTFLVAADCLKKGVNASKVSEIIFEQKSAYYFDDIREGLNHMYIDHDFPFMIVHIPHHPHISSENTVNFFRQYENIELVIVCKEIKKSEYRINFRSKQKVNVANIAKHFGGGGHIRASGATVQMSFSFLKAQLIDYSRQAF